MRLCSMKRSDGEIHLTTGVRTAMAKVIRRPLGSPELDTLLASENLKVFFDHRLKQPAQAQPAKTSWLCRWDGHAHCQGRLDIGELGTCGCECRSSQQP
jgi:hypothetical protein